jgi:hypothetical protein
MVSYVNLVMLLFQYQHQYTMLPSELNSQLIYDCQNLSKPFSEIYQNRHEILQIIRANSK